jgi:hypothetical protein
LNENRDTLNENEKRPPEGGPFGLVNPNNDSFETFDVAVCVEAKVLANFQFHDVFGYFAQCVHELPIFAVFFVVKEQTFECHCVGVD